MIMLVKRTLISVALVGALLVSTGCRSSIAANDYKRRDVGALTRVEAAQVLSQRSVRIDKKRRGITYVVKLEKTGETLALTQPDDVSIANGGLAWVEFGNRLRVVPR
jgi:hypothetical protein